MLMKAQTRMSFDVLISHLLLRICLVNQSNVVLCLIMFIL